jgi:hypothetical protein
MAYKDKEKQKATVKAWRERNRERVRAENNAWYERNRERRLLTVKAWRERNRERTAATDKAWVERNREHVIERNRRRRCKKKNASVRLTVSEQKKLFLMEQTRLELQKETGRKYHIDHILPIVHGGIHHPINLRILEKKENELKQAKLLPEGIDLAYEHFRLYHDRVSPERAWEFVHQLAEGLGISVDEIRIDDQQIKLSLPTKSTLEDLME